MFLSSSDATKSYINIDYAPLNDLLQAMLIKTRSTPETLPRPVARRFVSTEQINLQDFIIEGILQATLPNRTIVRVFALQPFTNFKFVISWFTTHNSSYAVLPRQQLSVSWKPRDGSITAALDVLAKSVLLTRHSIVTTVQRKQMTSNHITNLLCAHKTARELQHSHSSIRRPNTSSVSLIVEHLITDTTEVVFILCTLYIYNYNNSSPKLSVESFHTSCQGTTLDDTPPVIKNIVGKRCAFDVKINSYNTERGCEEFTVYRLNECVGCAEDEGDKKGDETTKKKKQKMA
ncbi:hypothetical protein POM88_011427 [Heracleum sosnowskyi]|uniref:Uncharacterized protein n=1 Tax=Heracleum sosnowskyi TaxID=360622 RepID=A0AAD8N181_9APIA|nr:hypothetical protein POM88_011427 [Heracleum sosnowskyi]